MNKIFLLGLIGLLTLASCGEKKSSKTAEKADEAQLKIAYYIKDSVPNNLIFYKEFATDIEEKAKVYEERLFKLQQEGQNMLQSYQRQMQAGLLTQNQAQSYEQRIQKKQEQMQVLQETEGADIERQNYEGNLAVIDKLEKYAKQYSEENGYTMMFAWQQAGQILYMEPSMDVTMDFINFMNEKEGDAPKADKEEKEESKEDSEEK